MWETEKDRQTFRDRGDIEEIVINMERERDSGSERPRMVEWDESGLCEMNSKHISNWEGKKKVYAEK